MPIHRQAVRKKMSI